MNNKELDQRIADLERQLNAQNKTDGSFVVTGPARITLNRELITLKTIRENRRDGFTAICIYAIGTAIIIGGMFLGSKK